MKTFLIAADFKPEQRLIHDAFNVTGEQIRDTVIAIYNMSSRSVQDAIMESLEAGKLDGGIIMLFATVGFTAIVNQFMEIVKEQDNEQN